MAEVIKNVQPLQQQESATPNSERLTAGQFQQAGEAAGVITTKAARERAKLPTRARVQRIDLSQGTAPVPKEYGRIARPVLTPEGTAVPQAQREMAPAEEEIEETAAPRPEWAKDFSDEDWKSLMETESSDGGLQKAYLNLRRQFGKQSNEIAQARRMAQQPPPTPVAPTAPPAPPIDLKALGEHFLDDIPGSVQKLYESATQAAVQKLETKLQEQQRDAGKQLAIAISNKYPGLLQEEADGIMVDNIALKLAGDPENAYKSHAEILDLAMQKFAKRVNYQVPKEKTPPNPEVEAMVSNSVLPPPQATVRRRAHVFTGTELAQIRANPQEAARRDAEIQRAYNEGRVDLSR